MTGCWTLYYSWECDELSDGGTSGDFCYSNNGSFNTEKTSGTWELIGNSYTHVYSNGTTYTGAYSNGVVTGTMISAEDGDKGCFRLVNDKEIEDTDIEDGKGNIDLEQEYESEIFMNVEQMPEFPGGQTALLKYIARNTNYPDTCKRYNITGKVFVTFVVEKDGAVNEVEILRSVDKYLDAEALRVIRSLPRFKPGTKRGKAVRVRFTVPINFTLN